MTKYRRFALVLAMLLMMTFAACSPVDEDYGETSEVSDVSEVSSKENTKAAEDKGPLIMSSDRVMSKYFDISLFDEENYADIYLGEDFDIKALYSGKKLNVPTNIREAKVNGWKLAKGNEYNENSLVFAYETIDATIVDGEGNKLKVQFYNSSHSSVKLSQCNIVKYRIENEFYVRPKTYEKFDINGINNSMAITDIINVLGTPSHFYRVSDKSYYLDYFISKEDRRNGITVYINPLEDCITSVEFSYYE